MGQDRSVDKERAGDSVERNEGKRESWISCLPFDSHQQIFRLAMLLKAAPHQHSRRSSALQAGIPDRSHADKRLLPLASGE
jgi:hypothetical protein